MSDTIKIDELKNENKKLLYKHLWENKHFGFNVIRTGKTDPSYQGFRIIHFLQLFQGILRVYRKAFAFQK